MSADHPSDTRLAVLEERLRGMDIALNVRTDEIARRLHDLNHAHEQAVEVQQTYVSAEVHERDVTAARARAEAVALALEEARKATDERFSKIERFQATLTGGLILFSFVGIANLVKVWTG